MKRILLFGSQGLLGLELFEYFSTRDDVELVPLASFHCDITDHEELLLTLEKYRPDVILNAAAFSNVDACEDRRGLAVAINAEAPGVMAKWAKGHGAQLVHFSTDYVFDGEQGGYQEEDKRSPINVYGESKARGEELVMTANPEALILRTAWLFRKGRGNMVTWFLDLAKRGKEIPAIEDEWGNVTFAGDIPPVVATLLEKGEAGVYHLVGGEETTPLEMAEHIVSVTNSSSLILKKKSDELERKAKRPKNTTLVSTKGALLPSWKEGLKEFL